MASALRLGPRRGHLVRSRRSGNLKRFNLVRTQVAEAPRRSAARVRQIDTPQRRPAGTEACTEDLALYQGAAKAALESVDILRSSAGHVTITSSTL